MYSLKELKEKLYEETEKGTVLWDDLHEAVSSDGDEVSEPLKQLGFDLLSCERTEGDGDFNGYQWVFELGGLTLAVDGSYGSWTGTEIDDIQSIYEVELKEITTEQWVPKNG